MAAQPEPRTGTRPALIRDRVLGVAVGIADERGIDALTMRSLARTLGVEAMSLYHYVSNKNEILDGLVDVVVGEINDAVHGIDAAAGRGDWKATTRRRILTSRAVLLGHPWAPRIIETSVGCSLPCERTTAPTVSQSQIIGWTVSQP